MTQPHQELDLSSFRNQAEPNALPQHKPTHLGLGPDIPRSASPRSPTVSVPLPGLASSSQMQPGRRLLPVLPTSITSAPAPVRGRCVAAGTVGGCYKT